jgi:hypothetical protein
MLPLFLARSAAQDCPRIAFDWRMIDDPARMSSVNSAHAYEVRPRKDKRGVDLISDAPPFRRLWYAKASDAVDYAKFFTRSPDAVIRVYDAAGNVIDTHEHRGDFKEW